MQRRKFIQHSGMLTMGMYAASVRAIAGPFLPGELVHNIPIDKKLDPQWVKSLFNRGSVTKYFKTKNELDFIGMPVGGIQTGTVYLGGDGRMWLWDIFNKNQSGIETKSIEYTSESGKKRKITERDGAAYIDPSKNKGTVDQGFAFRIKKDNHTIIKKMESTDWDEIIFEATYPMAKVHYIDKQIGLEITANIFSPFIPLDEKNSGLPCTIYNFEIKNTTAIKADIAIIGWLENKASIRSATQQDQRENNFISYKNISIVQCSIQQNQSPTQKLAPDFGTMCISALGKSKAQTNLSFPLTSKSFDQSNINTETKSPNEKLIASTCVQLTVMPNKTSEIDFVFSWHFVNLKLHKSIEDTGRYYNNWFSDASKVAAYVFDHATQLKKQSKLWSTTFYDSTLPWWFLERTFLNISTLATTTAHRFESGRFYAWEGVGCCEGTCTHVWQYAQAMARIFPGIEKDTRSRIDLGLSFQPDGMIWYRGEVVKTAAIDGQAGTILRIYREHQMSSDHLFLKDNWDKIKQAIKYVIHQDRNEDGMEDTPIENTLDAVWDGSIAWLVGLCIAAVKAGALMAEEMQDTEFQKLCNDYVHKGAKNMEEQLFNGEYFIHLPDSIKGREKLGSYNTCHIDQVYGQSWAHQVGMGQIINKEKTTAALRALWKYNFTPDVGPYIKERAGGRPYVLPGEGGLVMNTNPLNEKKPYGEKVTWQLGYFHECMSGFEHQVAAHMMAEGMIEESLVITRMIHDRYHAAKRNPFNEIECSDHYARAMASYGTFLSACGFEYHGPKGHIGFAPKVNDTNFKAPFTTAEGWGSFEQIKKDNKIEATLDLKYGSLRLKTIALQIAQPSSNATINLNGEKFKAEIMMEGNRAMIQLPYSILLKENQTLAILI